MKAIVSCVTKRNFQTNMLLDNSVVRSLVRIVVKFWNSEPAAFASRARWRVLASDARK